MITCWICNLLKRLWRRKHKPLPLLSDEEVLVIAAAKLAREWPLYTEDIGRLQKIGQSEGDIWREINLKRLTQEEMNIETYPFW